MKNRDQRRARRKRILSAAIRLAHELFPEDEGKRKAWLIKNVAGSLDIPLINEKTEEIIISAIIELLEDLVD
tara:strand:+ start:110 stop:325 length:216 start_codon:yes stop_codon:yes gene_type:complete